ncbi:MAG: 4Fe-4S dicluster domain-containing protein [Thermoplasmata archaeon]
MKVDPAFRQELARGGAFDASACLNCGSCTALCPLGLSEFPRKFFRLVLMGARERVLEESDTIFSCLLCKMCEENCPAGVHITDNVRALRVYIDREVFHLGVAGA